MRLAAFIRANIQPISVEWERFAATLRPEQHISPAMLRDDIVGLLVDIADYMDQEQRDAAQQITSEAEPNRSQDTDGAIAGHVVSRIAIGLSSRQFISEFRALRATVIRLWQRDTNTAEIENTSLDDLIRFNEAIDQVLTDGAVNFFQEIDRSRELFLGTLGHDLRNPVAAISALAELQLQAKTPERHAEFSSRILVSTRRISHLISDLLELARVRLGSGIILHPTPTSLRSICEAVVEEMQAVFPKRSFQINGDAERPGDWDQNRLSQVLTNLVSNAAQHGASNSTVTITVKSSLDAAEIEVHNEGAPIPPEVMPKLFDAFYRPQEGDTDIHSAGLGLGLYIAREIITAHGGTIDVRSSIDEGTTFIIRLPNA